MATPILFDHSEQACLVLYLKQNITHESTKSQKMFQTTKDMFYKQFDFFGELTWPIMGLREPCPLRSKT